MTVIKAFDEDAQAWQTVVVGKQGPAGVVDADLPITYDAGTQTVGWAGDTDDVPEGTTNLYNRVPTGGVAGDVLVKDSATDFDLSYGVRARTWQPLSGFYYGPLADSTATGTLNRVMVFPVYFSVPTAVNGLRCQVTTAGTAGSVVRMGIYLPGTDGKPDGLLVDAGTVDATSTGIKIASISETVSGLIWLAAVAQGALPTTRRSSLNRIPYEYGMGDATAELNLRVVLFQDSVTGALPSTFASNASGVSGMTVQVGVA